MGHVIGRPKTVTPAPAYRFRQIVGIVLTIGLGCRPTPLRHVDVLRNAQISLQSKDYSQAFREYRWFFEEGYSAAQPSSIGWALSVLPDVVELSRHSDETRVYLEQLERRLELVAITSTAATAADVPRDMLLLSELYAALGHWSRTIETISKSKPAIRVALWRDVLRFLISKKDYGLVRDHADNCTLLLERDAKRLKIVVAGMGEIGAKASSGYRLLEERFREDAADCFEGLLGSEEDLLAKGILAHAVKHSPGKATVETLRERATKLGRSDWHGIIDETASKAEP